MVVCLLWVVTLQFLSDINSELAGDNYSSPREQIKIIAFSLFFTFLAFNGYTNRTLECPEGIYRMAFAR